MWFVLGAVLFGAALQTRPRSGAGRAGDTVNAKLIRMGVEPEADRMERRPVCAAWDIRPTSPTFWASRRAALTHTATLSGFEIHQRSAGRRIKGTETWSCTMSQSPSIFLKHAVKRTQTSFFFPSFDVPLIRLSCARMPRHRPR